MTYMSVRAMVHYNEAYLQLLRLRHRSHRRRHPRRRVHCLLRDNRRRHRLRLRLRQCRRRSQLGSQGVTGAVRASPRGGVLSKQQQTIKNQTKVSV
jgi:hypothetical protein